MRSWRKFLTTDCRASLGHSENQSIVQQVMRLGNWRSREQNTSPIGLEVRGGEGEGGGGGGGGEERRGWERESEKESW